jgi:large subunit ribosomal protein L7/L12
MATKSYERMLDDIGNMSVIELADFVKALEDKFGVTAAMPVAAAGGAVAAEAAPAAEEKSTYKVTLKEGGSEKIKTIKALRQVVPSLSLSDAKKAVEEAPTVLVESAPKEDADKIKKELEAVGAKVELA